MHCSPPGSSVHRISQGRILEWVAISSSRGTSPPRDRTQVSCLSCIGKQIFYHCTTWEVPGQSEIIFKTGTGTCLPNLQPPGFLLRIKFKAPSASSRPQVGMGLPSCPPIPARPLTSSRTLHRLFLAWSPCPPHSAITSHLPPPAAKAPPAGPQLYLNDSCGSLFFCVIIHSLDSTLAPGPVCLSRSQHAPALAGAWPRGKDTSRSSSWCPRGVGGC